MKDTITSVTAELQNHVGTSSDPLQGNTWSLILQLVELAVAATPTLIQDVENLLAKIKGVPTGDPATTPLEPVVEADTADLASKL